MGTHLQHAGALHFFQGHQDYMMQKLLARMKTLEAGKQGPAGLAKLPSCKAVTEVSFSTEQLSALTCRDTSAPHAFATTAALSNCSTYDP